jgi:glycosyltransferase involved in cell wall biosynthesis
MSTNEPDIAVVLQTLQIGDELFWEPLRHVLPGAWTSHVPLAFWLTKVAKPRIFVELGTHSGNSYCAYCQAIDRFAFDTRAFAVDTWRGDEHSGLYDESVFEDLKQFNDTHFASFSKLVRSTFDEAREYFADKTVDLLHIDGLHTYEAVKHDFEQWKDAISPSGVVVFHDTNVRERGFGVWKLWRELTQIYPSFEFHHGEGLGILGVGSKQSPVLEALFGMQGDIHVSSIIRKLFATRGEVFWTRVQNLDLRDRVGRLVLQVEEQSARIGDLEAEIASHPAHLKAEIELRDNRLQDQAMECERLADRLALTEKDRERERSAGADEKRQLQHQIAILREQQDYLKATTAWKVASQISAALAPYPTLRRGADNLVRLLWWTINVRARKKIERSSYFDAVWYLSKYPDVAAAGCDPAEHYALFGGLEGRDPGPHFSGAEYLRLNSDVWRAGANPLLHYLEHGRAEGRAICPAAGSLDTVTSEASMPGSRNSVTEYLDWVQRYDTLSEQDKADIHDHVKRFRSNLLISVVMPVYNTPPRFLRKALDSVLAQLYPTWELCIADDASTNPEVRTILDEYARRDRRVKVVYRSQNGHISAASNSALALASGDFIALMDHDDELPQHALYMVAAVLDDRPDLDIIYSDEDKIDAEGIRQGPYFKPDWNQELFYSQNYLNHLGVYRASLVRALGGFREGYEGTQDYDLVLRLLSVTQSERVEHIPHILYHWRIAGGVQTLSLSNLPTAVLSSRRALADHFIRRAENVKVVAATLPQYNRVLREVTGDLPLVSVVIPTRDRVDLLRQCIDGLLFNTNYANIEVLVVDNQSCEVETLSYLESLRSHCGIHIISAAGEFNYSALNNRAVRVSEGELVLLLNSDIEVINPGWLSEMVGQVLQSGVAAVGAKLYYPNNTIQHAGVILGLGGIAGHSHCGLPRGDAGYFGRLRLVHEVSCVTGACLLVRKSAFLQVGGLDEIGLKVAFNDVDLCLKLRRAGYRIIWTPYAELYHLESASRGSDFEARNVDRFAKESEIMRTRWGKILMDDPLYNPNLSLIAADHRPAFPPRSTWPWRQVGGSKGDKYL